MASLVSAHRGGAGDDHPLENTARGAPSMLASGRRGSRSLSRRRSATWVEPQAEVRVGAS